jgi:hypothetical protein
MLCAVLAGLFLMHGAPATAAEGCHGVMSAPMLVPAPAPAPGSADMGHGTTTASRASVSPHGHEARARSAGGPALPAAPVVEAGAASTGHGALCVATPARERAPLPVHALLMVVTLSAVWALAGRAVVRGRAGRGGPPPPGGRALLRLVSVART